MVRTRQQQQVKRRLQESEGRSNEYTTSNRGSSSAANTEESTYLADNDYGFAYSTQYEGGFYYGDQSTSEGALPQCFPEDYECQSDSSKREAIMLGISFGIVAVVIIAVVVCYLCNKARNKPDEDKFLDPR